MPDPVDIRQDLIDIINRRPDKFTLLQAYLGSFGSLIYRIICGSDDRFCWKEHFCGTYIEDLKPLEWPRKTEGFFIYDTPELKNSFKENHFSTVHIGIKLLEKMNHPKELLSYHEIGKNLLLKTHNLDCHNYINAKSVRIYGDVSKIIKNKDNTVFRYRAARKYIDPVDHSNVHNLCIENIFSADFDVYLEEYLKLCQFLDMLPNINNVRAFILFHKEKLERYDQ